MPRDKKTKRFLENLLIKLKGSLHILLIFVVLILCLSLARNLSRISTAERRITEKQQELNKLKKETEDARKRLEEVSSDMYVEKQLRDTLGLTKEGETVVILPDKEILRSLAPKLEDEEDVLPDPNWKRWTKLFF
jgi:cell division protein FtsB